MNNPMATATRSRANGTGVLTPEQAADAALLAAKKAGPIEPVARLELEPLPTSTMLVPIRGTAPLIMSRFSEKAREMMLKGQQGEARAKRVRNPDEEYERAFYLLSDAEDGTTRYGFPTMAFKKSVIGACRFFGKAVTMTSVRQFIFVDGEEGANDPQMLVEIIGEPHMRRDVVRLAGQNRPADLRFRPAFDQWETELRITYFSSCISGRSVLSLLGAAGIGVGVGEWRVERDGVSGTYEIHPDKPVQWEVITDDGLRELTAESPEKK